jgi:antitoxin (DNA-binding transcriptional repressor) of toxin-antitoxin stability system
VVVPSLKSQYTTSKLSTDKVLVYTMRDLDQHTARVMAEIEKTGKPALVTKHGRFVAMITPLRPGQIESRVLAKMAREIGKRDQS